MYITDIMKYCIFTVKKSASISSGVAGGGPPRAALLGGGAKLDRHLKFGWRKINWESGCVRKNVRLREKNI